MRIIGCCNVYQDASMLKHSLPVLRKFVDVLVVVDGAYAKFPLYKEDPESTDGTLALAQEYADVIVFTRRDKGVSVPWKDEIEKRNKYLIGHPGDYYLVVDADEIVEGAIDRTELQKNPDWFVMLKRAGDNTRPYGIHRLFRHRPGICYAGTHHAVHVGKKLIHPDKPKLPQFPGLLLNHLQMLRDQDRVERKGEYYRDLQVVEAGFRKREGL